jgi:hypothetical protein
LWDVRLASLAPFATLQAMRKLWILALDHGHGLCRAKTRRTVCELG